MTQLTLTMNTGIVCAGHIIVDLVKVIDSWPREGMLVSIESEQQHGGGLVYNCLVDLARLDPSIPLHGLGIVGNDQYGHYVTGQLNQFGIDCRHIRRTDTSPTSYTNVMSVKNGQRTFFHMEGASRELDISDLLEHDLHPKFFHLGYLTLLPLLDTEHEKYGTRAAKVLKKMQDRGCKTSVDLVSVTHPHFKKIVQAALPYTDYLIVNEVETGMATDLTLRSQGGEIDQAVLARAADQLLKAGVKESVVIHFPEGGFARTTTGKSFFVPSFRLESSQIMGSVGAGDAFCAGLLYGLYHDFPMEKCLRFGHGCARFSLLHETSTEGIPSAEKVMALI